MEPVRRRSLASAIAVVSVTAACAPQSAPLIATEWPAVRLSYSCPLRLSDSAGTMTLTLDGSGVSTVEDRIVDSYGDYVVRDGSGDQDAGQRRVRVDCRSLRVRGPAPPFTPTDRTGPGWDQCTIENYRTRFGIADALGPVVHEDSLDVRLVRLAGPRLMYPRAMRDAGYQGWVVVGALIGPNGRTASAHAVASSRPEFEEASVGVILGGAYTRPLKGGRPVTAFLCQRINFTVTR